MLGEAIKQPGLDTRYWVSEGTVGTVKGPDPDDFDTNDKMAIHNDSSGCHVDVRLEPLMIPVTCQYAGIQAGDVTIYAPIRPGNRVVVSLPDGDLTGGIITAILNSRSMRQPTEGRRPIFDNNRLLIHAQSVPIDIRTAGGAQISLLQDGTVRLGAADAIESVVKGNARKTAEDTELNLIGQGLDTLISASEGGPCAVLLPGLVELKAAFAAFRNQLESFLSDKVKTK
jgi:hypothetical protein